VPVGAEDDGERRRIFSDVDNDSNVKLIFAKS